MLSKDTERYNGQYRLDLRLSNIQQAMTSASAMRGFVDRCKEDRPFAFNNCLNTYNPQAKGVKNLPFLLCLRQEEAVEHIKYCQDNELDSLSVKTRKVGESWLHMGHCELEWTLADANSGGWSGIAGSRLFELVEAGVGESKENQKDTGDMDSLFAKFDYMERRLPPFMRVKEYAGGEKPWKVKGLRKNPYNGSQFKAEAATESFGSGGRAAYGLIDELSKCKNGRKAWESCGQTVPSRHAIFTPVGREFAWSLCFPKEAEIAFKLKNLPRPQVFRISYKDIPWFNQFFIFDIPANRHEQWETRQEFDDFLEKNRDRIIYEGNGYSPKDIVGGVLSSEDDLCDNLPLGCGYDDGHGNITELHNRKPIDRIPNRGVSIVYPWREREGTRYDEEGAAQELDISFGKAKKGRVYSIAYSRSKKEPDIVRRPELPLYCGYDPGRSGGNAMFIFWAQWNWYRGGYYEFLREFSIEGRSAYYLIPLLTGNEEYFPLAEEEVVTRQYLQLWEEMQDPIWRPDRVFGDPAVVAFTANTKESVRNIFTRYGIALKTDPKWTTFPPRVSAARKMLPYSIFDERHVPELMAGLQGVAWLEEMNNSQTLTEKAGYGHHPVFSHPAAAYEYFALGDPHKFEHGVTKKDIHGLSRIYTQQQFQDSQGEQGRPDRYQNRGYADVVANDIYEGKYAPGVMRQLAQNRERGIRPRKRRGW